MNDKKIIIPASAIILLIYLVSSYQTDFFIFLPSAAAFIAGAVFSYRRKSPLCFLIFSEILVINNQALISSLLIQLAAGLSFLIYYLQEEVYSKKILIAVYVFLTSIFAYWAFTIRISEYTLLCMAAIFAGYMITEFQWRKIKTKTVEEI